MAELKSLSSSLKVLEIFNLQYFSLADLSFNSRLDFASTYFVIYYFVSMVLYIFCKLTIPLNLVSFDGNILAFFLLFLIDFLIVIRGIVGNTEPFLKIKSHKRFFVILNQFNVFIETHFETSLNFSKVKKSAKIRLILIIVAIAAFTIKIIIDEDSPDSYLRCLKIFVHFKDVSTALFILYMALFYFHIIFMCLEKLLEVIESLKYDRSEKGRILSKIYAMKRSYIYILQMTDELNNFIGGMVSLFIITYILFFSLRFYELFLITSADTNFADTGKQF